MPSCCSKSNYRKLTVKEQSQLKLNNSEYLKDDTFKLPKGQHILPYDCKIITGSCSLNKKSFLDEFGYVQVDNKANLYSGYQVVLSAEATFKKINSNDKQSNLSTKPSKTISAFFEQKFSFFLFLLAFAASIYAQIVGISPVMSFSAVLMCICPCVFLFADLCLSTAGKSILAHKGIHFQGKDLLTDLDKIRKAKIWSDYTGTLTKVELNNDRREIRHSEGLKIKDQKITLDNKHIFDKIISGYDQIKQKVNIGEYHPDKGKITVGQNILYFANGINDIKLCQKPNVYGCAVYNSPNLLQQNANFISIKPEGEIEAFASIPKFAQRITLMRYFLYFLALVYAITIIPLAISGTISPMFACLAICLSGPAILFLSQIFKLFASGFKSKPSVVDKEKAKEALRKIAYISKCGKIISEYSKEQIYIQLKACGIDIRKSKGKMEWLAILFLGLVSGISFVNSPVLQSVLHYLYLPIILICLAAIIKKGYKKIFAFVTGSLAVIGSQVLVKLYNLPKATNVLGCFIAFAMLVVLYKHGLDMYQVQLSAILVLSVADLAGIARMHAHHFLIMGLLVLLAKRIKSYAPSQAIKPLEPDSVPDYFSPRKVESVSQALLG